MVSGPMAPPPPEEEARRRRRQATVVVGLLVTLAGVALAAETLPVAPSALGRAILVVGGAVFLSWLGGVLMGLGSGRRAARARR